MKHIGEKIRLRRIELGLTQEELATKMGYNSKSTINKIEAGINDIPHSKVVEFSKVLNIPIENLIESNDGNFFENKLGRKIKNARLSKGMTQEELGILLGVEKSAVAKYENGRIVNLKQSTLKKISEIFDIPISDLIVGDDKIKDKSINDTEKKSSRDVFSANLRHLMAKANKSRKEVSEAIGISYSTFSDWCNGKKYPRIEKLELLAEYFDISTSELIGTQNNIINDSKKPKINNISLSEKNESQLKQDTLNIIIRLHSDENFFKLVDCLNNLDKNRLEVIEQFLNMFI